MVCLFLLWYVYFCYGMLHYIVLHSVWVYSCSFIRQFILLVCILFHIIIFYYIVLYVSLYFIVFFALYCIWISHVMFVGFRCYTR